MRHDEPIYVSPELSSQGLLEGQFRMSTDGRLVAVSERGMIELFEVTP